MNLNDHLFRRSKITVVGRQVGQQISINLDERHPDSKVFCLLVVVLDRPKLHMLVEQQFLLPNLCSTTINLDKGQIGQFRITVVGRSFGLSKIKVVCSYFRM